MTPREQKLRENFFNRTAQKMLLRLSKGKGAEFEELVSKSYEQNHPKKFLRRLKFIVFKDKVTQAFEKIKAEEEKKEVQQTLLEEAKTLLQANRLPTQEIAGLNSVDGHSQQMQLFKPVLCSEKRDHDKWLEEEVQPLSLAFH